MGAGVALGFHVVVTEDHRNRAAGRGCTTRLVRSWLVGSGSIKPCRSKRLCQNRPDPASEYSRIGRNQSAACPPGMPQGLSGNHRRKTWEDFAQRRKDAKCGFPQFIPLFLCALAALRDTLFFHQTISRHGESLGKGMIEICARSHSSVVPSLIERLDVRPPARLKGKWNELEKLMAGWCATAC